MSDHDSSSSTIFEIARILASEHDPSILLHKILCCLVQVTEAADAGMILLADELGQLRLSTSVGYDASVLKELRLAPGESMAGQAFMSGRPALYPSTQAMAAARANLSPENRRLVERASADERDGSDRPPTRRPSFSAVCLPLFAGQKTAGVLFLENLHQPGSFTPGDLEDLAPAVDLIGLAIENAGTAAQLRSAAAVNEGNRLKAELISTLAHEMRTPLTSIKGYSTALLLDEANFSPDTQREFLQIIDEECDILKDLITDLLESSVIDAGFLKLEPEPVLLPRLAQAVVDDIARRNDRHHFVVDFPAGFPILDADPHRIMQVLRNLLDNAVKYSPNGGLVVVRGEAGVTDVTVSVADQGEGIAPEHLNRLFEKYFRVKSGLGRHVVGVGLGLPIARTIVESHGGRIWAESQLNQGTVFYFTVPLTQARFTERPRGGEVEAAAPIQSPGGLPGGGVE